MVPASERATFVRIDADGEKKMKSHKVTSAEDYKIVSSFQSVRKTLLDEKFADRLEKPLAYWAMPNDRRLPLAFLGRTIKDLLATPFEELSATPGIGQKKISSLVKLLVACHQGSSAGRAVRHERFGRGQARGREARRRPRSPSIRRSFPRRCGPNGWKRFASTTLAARSWAVWLPRCSRCRP